MKRRLASSVGCMATLSVLALLLPGSAQADTTQSSAHKAATGITSRIRPNVQLAEKASKPAPEDGPVVASGTVTDPDGAPLADLPIRVDLEPNRAQTNEAQVGSGVALVKLGETTTDAAGAFTVKAADLGSLQGYTESDGSASVLITSLTPRASVYQHVIVTPSLKHGTTWKVAVKDDKIKRKKDEKAVAALRRQGYVNADPATDMTGLTLTSNGPTTDASISQSRSATLRASSINGSSYCSYSYY